MGWFRKSPPPPDPAIDKTLATLHDVQAKMLAQNQDFLVKVAEMALSSAGRALGVRSARGRKRDEKGRLMPKREAAAPSCKLCSNPLFTRPTLAMIDAHRQHELRDVPDEPPPPPPGEVGQ